MAHPGGRPSKLDAAFIQKAEEYLLGYEELGDVIPSIAGLALFTRVRRATIHAWMAGELPDVDERFKTQFSDIISELQEAQEQKLLNGGLSGAFNSTITKLVLSKHDYSDKVDNVSSDGSMSPNNELKVTVSRSSKGE